MKDNPVFITVFSCLFPFLPSSALQKGSVRINISYICTSEYCRSFCVTTFYNRRAGCSLNRVETNIIGGHNLPPLVGIGLRYLPSLCPSMFRHACINMISHLFDTSEHFSNKRCLTAWLLNTSHYYILARKARFWG